MSLEYKFVKQASKQFEDDYKEVLKSRDYVVEVGVDPTLTGPTNRQIPSWCISLMYEQVNPYKNQYYVLNEIPNSYKYQGALISVKKYNFS